MKKALVVLLVVVVLVTGLPILIGMSGMANCHDCGPAVAAAGCALAILAAGLVLALATVSERLRRRRGLMMPAAHRFLLERPPQLV